MRFVKPLDEELVLRAGRRAIARLVTLEENAVAGGAGSAVGEAAGRRGRAAAAAALGIPDRFIEHGSREDCLAAAGLDLGRPHARAIERWWAAAAAGAHALRRRRLKAPSQLDVAAS